MHSTVNLYGKQKNLMETQVRGIAMYISESENEKPLVKDGIFFCKMAIAFLLRNGILRNS